MTPRRPPTQEGLDQLSNDFWYHLLWGAKKLRRGELMWWRAHDQDTWHGYRFFERWAGEAAPEALRPTFAQYEASCIGRALCAKGELFGQLEHDVAQRFGLAERVDRPEILRRLDALMTDDLA
jgi:aminoglycoside 6-adenylyltransferase